MISSEKKNYRVLWSSPNYPKRVYRVGIFQAVDDAEAESIFERDYKNDHVYEGDTLVLVRIDRPEETTVVAKREIPQ